MMLPSTGARTPLLALAVSAGCVLIFVFGFMTWQSPSRMSFPHDSTHIEMTVNGGQEPLNIKSIISFLYAPLKISPTEPFIREPNGTRIVLPKSPRYTKKLGTDVLILDLETRPLQSTLQYVSNGTFDWRNLGHVPSGIFNHWTYAQVHGYDYKFIHAQNFEDRHATWIKPSALANLIKNYKFIVFLDADATFRFMHLPVEWMMNYWKIEPHHSITMAKDPWTAKEPQYNSDRFNRTYTNTGFMVVQNNENIMPILKAWHECPEDVRYANCSQWKYPKFHEQSAFGEYIRYDYEDNIKELDCGEANGFPGVEISNCQGKFIRHYWFQKDLVKQDFRDNMMNAITLPIQRMFADNSSGVVVNTAENVIHE